MGWHINLVENTLVVPREAALEILSSEGTNIAGVLRDYDFTAPAKRFLSELLDEDDHFVFNPDHMEHMDFVWEEDVIDALKRHKAKGDVVFCSHDGDNKGQMWSYHFDGKGGYEHRSGKMPKLTKRKH